MDNVIDNKYLPTFILSVPRRNFTKQGSCPKYYFIHLVNDDSLKPFYCTSRLNIEVALTVMNDFGVIWAGLIVD